MTTILVDTNVVLDVLLERIDFVAASARVIGLVEHGRVDGYLCAAAVDTLDYLMSKPLGTKASRAHLRTLRRIIRIAAVDELVIDSALELDWPDLEDAIVHECARYAGVDVVVTRNSRAFAKASLTVLTPEEFLAAWYVRAFSDAG